MVRRRISRPGVIGTAVALVLVLSHAATAQTNLGSQRVATASATFLKIGLDARGAALGGAYTALADGPMAPFCNPAGISNLKTASGGFGYALWPADINVVAAAYARPLGGEGAAFGVSAEYVGTTMDETTEFYPTGTGRTFSYSDILFGVSAAKPFNDRLSIGGSVKFIREDLGSGIGGPVAQSWLVDAGTVYMIGALNGRLAISLTNFGPYLRPSGTYDSHVRRDQVTYASFSPPTSFRMGLSLEPYRKGANIVTVATEVVHVSDNQETVRAGVEYQLQDHYFLRAGMDPAADAARFSAGLGVKIPLSKSDMRIDYAYTDGGPLLAIHRWSVLVPF